MQSVLKNKWTKLFRQNVVLEQLFTRIHLNGCYRANSQTNIDQTASKRFSFKIHKK